MSVMNHAYTVGVGYRLGKGLCAGLRGMVGDILNVGGGCCLSVRNRGMDMINHTPIEGVNCK